MGATKRSTTTWEPIPDGDAERIVVECGRCYEEEADELEPPLRFRMLAILRAMEATTDHKKGFTVEAVCQQIGRIEAEGEDVPAEVVKAARAARREAPPTAGSFFSSYVSGRNTEKRKRRFNYYIRSACHRLGLGYQAVIGCLEDGKPARYLLKRAPSPSKTVAIAGEESFSTVSLAALEDAERLSVLIGRGALLLAKKGWGADQVGGVYKEAVELADKMIRARRPGVDRARAEAGIGLWSNSLVRGNLRVAKNEGKKLLALADRNDDHSTRVVAYRVLGTNAFWLGQFVEAERFLRRCLLDLGDGSRYQPFATDLGASPLSFVEADLADALWALGRHREALATIDKACENALQQNQYFHYCYALAFSTWIRFKLGEYPRTADQARNLLKLARKLGLGIFRALGKTLEGTIRAFQSDDPSEGIACLYEGVGEWRACGSELLVCYFFTDAAKAWLRCGQYTRAEDELSKAFRVAATTGDGYCLAEIYRVRGEIRWRSKRRFAAAEKDLRRALQIASDQKAQTFRLRAAMSLLRFARARTDLEGDRLRHDAAREQRLLRSILRKLQHEPDSADLQEARSLLAGSTGRAVPDPAVVR